MAFALRTNSTGGNAYVQKTFGATHDEFWLTFDIRFETLPLLNGIVTIASAIPTSGTEDIIQIVYDGVNPIYWASGGGGTGANAVLTPSLWQTCEFHHMSLSVGTQGHFYVDNVLSASPTFTVNDVQTVRLGQFDIDLFFYIPPGIVFFDNIKVGTTRGASDIFSDDFGDGTTNAWTTVVGAVTVVDLSVAHTQSLSDTLTLTSAGYIDISSPLFDPLVPLDPIVLLPARTGL